MALLEIRDIKKTYTTLFGTNKVQAIDNISFSIEEGEYTAIMGESGSGKTTLLNLIATLDKPSSGQIYLKGQIVTDISEREISAFRRDHLGFVFQDFNLLDTLNVKDNILLPLILAGQKYKHIQNRLEKVLADLKIEKLANQFPYELSGGQKQRVAIARAIITNPEIILADEPTGALDSNSADRILDIFKAINRSGQTILMVTHSVKAASRANRILFLRDGNLFHQIYRGDLSDDALHKKISDTLIMLSSGGGPDER